LAVASKKILNFNMLKYPNDRNTVLNCIEVLKFYNKIEEAKSLCASFLQRHPGDEAIGKMARVFLSGVQKLHFCIRYCRNLMLLDPTQTQAYLPIIAGDAFHDSWHIGKGDNLKYKVYFYYDPEYKGYVADVLDLPGCISQGKTLEEAKENVKDAIAGYLEVEKKE